MFKFKKIAAVLTSAVMLSSTMGFAMAASYPLPFVTAGTADVAVVYGDAGAMSDLTAAIDIQQSLGALVTGTSGGDTSDTISGEVAALFSDSSRIYVNDTLDTAIQVVTKSATSGLPNALADSTISGNVDATISQNIEVGRFPQITFEKQPTSSDDPVVALKLSTTARSQHAYNLTATFSKSINFTHADTEGQSFSMFGQSFTIGSATDTTDIVLLKSAEKVSLSSDSPSAQVTVSGSEYTIELITASDTSATVSVTDSSGVSASAEINEAASKKVNGIEIAITSSDENNIKYVATIIAGSEKITLTDASEVKVGSSDTSIDGTDVNFHGGTTGAMSKLTISIGAADGDEDALKPGESLVDPIFGSIKLDFAGLNIADDSTDAREDITISNAGQDKLEVKFADHTGNEKTIQYIIAGGGSRNTSLQYGDAGQNISVFEKEILHENDYVVIGNENTGHLLKLTNANNGSSGLGSDKADFTDVFTGDTYSTVWSSEASGTLTVGGKSYAVTLEGGASISDALYNVTVSDNDGAAIAVIYPTIQTSKGANLAFYEPVTINVSGWDRGTTDLTTLKFPDGDGYTSATFSYKLGNISLDAWATNMSFAAANSTLLTVGKLTYNISMTSTAGDSVNVRLLGVDKTVLENPAIVVFEEKDDGSNYHALIITTEIGGNDGDGMGITDVERTWGGDLVYDSVTTATDSKITKEIDRYGTIVTTDTTDSDQLTAVISYPDEQINAKLYMAEVSASITPGTVGVAGGGGQVFIVKDKEVNSVSGKNLIVVGGSCINEAAAKILGSEAPICGADFTTKTEVGANQYIIKTVKSPYNDAKVAMLVAGFEAADTVNAVAMAKDGVTSEKDTSQVYPIVATTTA